jgi:hypothetical protein
VISADSVVPKTGSLIKPSGVFSKELVGTESSVTVFVKMVAVSTNEPPSPDAPGGKPIVSWFLQLFKIKRLINSVNKSNRKNFIYDLKALNNVG